MVGVGGGQEEELEMHAELYPWAGGVSKQIWEGAGLEGKMLSLFLNQLIDS